MRESPRWRPDEPARNSIYIKLRERIDTQDSCITFLLDELRALQKRVTGLEAKAAMITMIEPGRSPPLHS